MTDPGISTSPASLGFNLAAASRAPPLTSEAVISLVASV